ncbi:SRPBCC family protein [Methyloceanibacter sp.]|uniref:SRPBCC family protein n=1 Tax=Methyloceanibacter sp. TaxID=1965321 RepID=UPI003D6CF465
MRPIMRLTLGLCALAVILAGVALALPGHVTVARSVVINAPEPVIFPYLDNLRRFGDWSPWAARDPQLTVAYSGAEQGKGAKVEWTSDKPSVGAGSMEIIESTPNRHVDLAVSFNGLDGTSYYEIVPSGSGSKVTWGFGYESGTSPLKRWKGLMLDRYIGAEYRDALAKLKDKIETERKPLAPPPPPTATLGVPEQPGVVPGAPLQDGTAAPAADAGAAQPQAAPAVTDPAATQAATPPPAAQAAPSQPKTPAKRPRRP